MLYVNRATPPSPIITSVDTILKNSYVADLPDDELPAGTERAVEL